MGYQALLFCPDEKLARIVSQVFSELDFTVEPVNEPFGAVKKLMAQRYDAVVVDCDNEQNTSLLFKSARNSSVNQSALAIALVEGQSGVAKAYRIGANLVLTKPINVEQAKGTLRVARGLLRKTSDAAGAANSTPAVAPPKPAPPAAVRPPQPAASSRPPAPSQAPAPSPAIHKPEVCAPHPTYSIAPEFEPLQPSMAASASSGVKIAVVTPPAEVDEVGIVSDSLESKPEATNEVAQREALKPAAAPAPTLSVTTAAAAPAPAKETAVVFDRDSGKTIAPEIGKQEEIASRPAPQQQVNFTMNAGYSSGPSFAALGVEDDEESGGNKKIFIVAAAVLALVVAGYFGWSKFGHPQANTVPQQSGTMPQAQGGTATQPVPTSAPSAPESSPAASAPSRTDVATPTVVSPAVVSPTVISKSAAVQHAPSAQDVVAAPATHIEIGTAPDTTKKSPPAPIVVKQATAAKAKQPQAEESAPQVPNPLAVASSPDANLGGIMSSPDDTAKPVLARIKLSQGISQALLIKRVQPKYPPNALATHKEGAVQIEATINKDGIVVSPKVLSGDPTLAAAALEAVRQWRYKPYYLDGAPVEIQTQITINFKVAN